MGRVKELLGWNREPSGHLKTQFKPVESIRVLPWNVRFALQHGEAMLNSGEITSLYKSGYSDLGFYLSMKSAAENDQHQTQLLTAVAGRDFNPHRVTAEDAAEVLEALRVREVTVAKTTKNALEQRRATGIPAGKLAEVSRHGFDTWVYEFHAPLTTVFENNPGAELYIVANAPYIGLDAIAEHTVRRGRPLGILRTDRIDQQDLPVGRKIVPGPDGITIHDLPFDFQRPPGGVLFDDTIKTGANRRELVSFWENGGRYQTPAYTSARVIQQTHA